MVELKLPSSETTYIHKISALILRRGSHNDPEMFGYLTRIELVSGLTEVQGYCLQEF